MNQQPALAAKVISLLFQAMLEVAQQVAEVDYVKAVEKGKGQPLSGRIYNVLQGCPNNFG